MIADEPLRGAAWFQVRLLKKVQLLLVPQVDLSALSHAAYPIGQPQTKMLGEPWCYFLQHLLMRFAWCSPTKRLPARKMFRSLLISVMSFATPVISLTILRTAAQWTNATSLCQCVSMAGFTLVFWMWPLCLNVVKLKMCLTMLMLWHCELCLDSRWGLSF